MTSGLTTPDGIILGYASRSTRLFGQIVDGVVTAAPIAVSAILANISGALGVVALVASVVWAIFYYFLSSRSSVQNAVRLLLSIFWMVVSMKVGMVLPPRTSLSAFID